MKSHLLEEIYSKYDMPTHTVHFDLTKSCLSDEMHEELERIEKTECETCTETSATMHSNISPDLNYPGSLVESVETAVSMSNVSTADKTSDIVENKHFDVCVFTSAKKEKKKKKNKDEKKKTTLEIEEEKRKEAERQAAARSRLRGAVGQDDSSDSDNDSDSDSDSDDGSKTFEKVELDLNAKTFAEYYGFKKEEVESIEFSSEVRSLKDIASFNKEQSENYGIKNRLLNDVNFPKYIRFAYEQNVIRFNTKNNNVKFFYRYILLTDKNIDPNKEADVAYINVIIQLSFLKNTSIDFLTDQVGFDIEDATFLTQRNTINLNDDESVDSYIVKNSKVKTFDENMTAGEYLEEIKSKKNNKSKGKPPPPPPPSGTPSGTPSGKPSGTPSGTPSGKPSGTPSGTPSGKPNGDDAPVKAGVDDKGRRLNYEPPPKRALSLNKKNALAGLFGGAGPGTGKQEPKLENNKKFIPIDKIKKIFDNYAFREALFTKNLDDLQVFDSRENENYKQLVELSRKYTVENINEYGENKGLINVQEVWVEALKLIKEWNTTRDPPADPDQDPDQNKSKDPPAGPDQDPDQNKSKDPPAGPDQDPDQDPDQNKSKDPPAGPDQEPDQNKSKDPPAGPDQDPDQDPDQNKSKDPPAGPDQEPDQNKSKDPPAGPDQDPDQNKSKDPPASPDQEPDQEASKDTEGSSDNKDATKKILSIFNDIAANALRNGGANKVDDFTKFFNEVRKHVSKINVGNFSNEKGNSIIYKNANVLDSIANFESTVKDLVGKIEEVQKFFKEYVQENGKSGIALEGIMQTNDPYTIVTFLTNNNVSYEDFVILVSLDRKYIRKVNESTILTTLTILSSLSLNNDDNLLNHKIQHIFTNQYTLFRDIVVKYGLQILVNTNSLHLVERYLENIDEVELQKYDEMDIEDIEHTNSIVIDNLLSSAKEDDVDDARDKYEIVKGLMLHCTNQHVIELSKNGISYRETTTADVVDNKYIAPIDEREDNINPLIEPDVKEEDLTNLQGDIDKYYLPEHHTEASIDKHIMRKNLVSHPDDAFIDFLNVKGRIINYAIDDNKTGSIYLSYAIGLRPRNFSFMRLFTQSAVLRLSAFYFVHNISKYFLLTASPYFRKPVQYTDDIKFNYVNFVITKMINTETIDKEQFAFKRYKYEEKLLRKAYYEAKLNFYQKLKEDRCFQPDCEDTYCNESRFKLFFDHYFHNLYIYEIISYSLKGNINETIEQFYNETSKVVLEGIASVDREIRDTKQAYEQLNQELCDEDMLLEIQKLKNDSNGRPFSAGF